MYSLVPGGMSWKTSGLRFKDLPLLGLLQRTIQVAKHPDRVWMWNDRPKVLVKGAPTDQTVVN